MRCIVLAAAECNTPYLHATAACAELSAYGCWQRWATLVLYYNGQTQGIFLDGGTKIFCMVMFFLSIKPRLRCLISSH